MSMFKLRGLSGRAAGALALACLACPALAGEAKVKIDNFTFDPEILTIAAGTIVTFDNEDDIPHTIVAVDKSFRSKALDTGDTFTFTFFTPGEFDYFCGLHPHMKAKIVVTR